MPIGTELQPDTGISSLQSNFLQRYPADIVRSTIVHNLHCKMSKP